MPTHSHTANTAASRRARDPRRSPRIKVEPAVFTVADAAKALGVCPAKIRALVECGNLAAINIGAGAVRQLRIPKTAVEAYKAGRTALAQGEKL